MTDSNLHAFACNVAMGDSPEAAAAKLNAARDTEPVRRISGLLASHGMPWGLAISKSRNLVHVLDTIEPDDGDPRAIVAESLMRDDVVLARVIGEVSRQVVREWEVSHG